MVDGSWHWKSTISILNIDPERNIADGLSNRTNHYRRREQQHEKLPPVAQRWNFLSQDEYERPPTVPWFDIQGRVIPNHPELPVHLKNLQPKSPDLVQRVIRRTKRAKQRAKQKESLQVPPSPQSPLVLHAHEDFFPNYPEDWIDVTEEARYDYLVPTHATNVASRTTYDLANAEGAALQNAPAHIKQAVFDVHTVNTELHDHAHTIHGIIDLVLAQNRDVHILALKKLVQGEEIDQDIFPEDVRTFARNYFKTKERVTVLEPKWCPLCKVPASTASPARATLYVCNASTVSTRNPLSCA